MGKGLPINITIRSLKQTWVIKCVLWLGSPLTSLLDLSAPSTGGTNSRAHEPMNDTPCLAQVAIRLKAAFRGRLLSFAPAASRDGLVATGFLCMGNYDDQESDKDRLYSEVTEDQIDVVTRQFLGLTVSCARCHDHKFDPIPTADYYAMAGIFMSTRVLDTRSRIGANRLKVRMLSNDEKNRRNGILKERAELQKQFDALTYKTSPEAKRIERRLDALKAKSLPDDGEAMAAQEGA